MYSRILLFTTLATTLCVTVILVGGFFLWRPAFEAYLSTVATQSARGVADDAAAALQAMSEQETAVVSVVEAANDAVVSVVVRQEVPVYERVYEEFDPFGGLFGGGVMVPQVRERGSELREVGGGSGFVVSDSGLVVTNRHVVSADDAIYSVVFSDGQMYDVAVVARDTVLDVAILQIQSRGEDTEFPYLSFGRSSDLQLGQTVVVIGNALAEFNNTVSVGVVSGLSRSIVAQNRRGMPEQLDQVIQTDAAINPGNSGGPLLNLRGEVVGVSVATSRFGENISFALPADTVARVVRSVAETGEIVRPFLGVRYAMITPGMAELYDLDVSYGAIIIPGDDAAPAVLPDSPAALAGLQAEDVILAIDGRSLEDVPLAHVLRSKDVGDTVVLTIWRRGEEVAVEATLTAAP